MIEYYPSKLNKYVSWQISDSSNCLIVNNDHTAYVAQGYDYNCEKLKFGNNGLCVHFGVGMCFYADTIEEAKKRINEHEHEINKITIITS